MPKNQLFFCVMCVMYGEISAPICLFFNRTPYYHPTWHRFWSLEEFVKIYHLISEFRKNSHCYKIIAPITYLKYSTTVFILNYLKTSFVDQFTQWIYILSFILFKFNIPLLLYRELFCAWGLRSVQHSVNQKNTVYFIFLLKTGITKQDIVRPERFKLEGSYRMGLSVHR